MQNFVNWKELNSYPGFSNIQSNIVYTDVKPDREFPIVTNLIQGLTERKFVENTSLLDRLGNMGYGKDKTFSASDNTGMEIGYKSFIQHRFTFTCAFIYDIPTNIKLIMGEQRGRYFLFTREFGFISYVERENKYISDKCKMKELIKKIIKLYQNIISGKYCKRFSNIADLVNWENISCYRKMSKVFGEKELWDQGEEIAMLRIRPAEWYKRDVLIENDIKHISNRIKTVIIYVYEELQMGFIHYRTKSLSVKIYSILNTLTEESNIIFIHNGIPLLITEELTRFSTNKPSYKLKRVDIKTADGLTDRICELFDKLTEYIDE